MSHEPYPEPTIWEKQEQLRLWHEREYKKAYPTSVLYTGKDLFSPEEAPSYDALTEEQKEHKETLAYTLNCMLCSIGVNIGPFETEGESKTPREKLI